MKKLLTIFLLILSISMIFAIEKPNIHASIMLDAKYYDGESANKGFYDTSNRFQVRKAAVNLDGNLAKYMNYELEFGISTCQGAGIDFKLMDATLEYELPLNTVIAVQQGHILRGIAGVTECSDRMTMEKPVFFTSLFNCHPTGILVKTIQELGAESELEVEAAFMNGGNSTMDDEWDYNYGMTYRTPVTGLAITGVYNHIGRKYYNTLGQNYSRAGYRAIGGLEYINYNLAATGEYYKAKGYLTKDNEIEAWYMMLGYALKVNSDRLKAIQPYAMYEYWDKEAENDIDSEYTYLNIGLNFSLNKYTKLRFAYKTELENPSGVTNTPDSAIMRLQLVY